MPVRFAELTQIALLGTERQALMPPSGKTQLEQLQSQLDVNRRERSLLSLAALAAAHERVGALPARDNLPLPDPCPPETEMPVSISANSLLLRLLAGEFKELLPEWLELAGRSNQVSLPEALPPLLDTANSNFELREPILRVLGNRGSWLAAHNPDWSWVTGAVTIDESAWHTGERAARQSFLTNLRRTDPARARELLTGTWKEDPPEDRAAFLGGFEIGLSLQDEDFLESALADKRKEVRKAAATLLAKLPDSGLVQRMVERTKSLLKLLPAELGSVLKLKRGRPASIEVTLPAECDKTMQRDGIEPKPQQGWGEKAWWLIQLLEIVPLNFWTQEWQTSPAAIVAASQQGEWSKELIEGWTRAVVRQQNTLWSEAVFDAAVASRQFEKIDRLLTALPVEQREARLMSLLIDHDAKNRDLHWFLISQARHNWSPGFSRAVLSFLRKETAQESVDWHFRSQLSALAARLSPEVLNEAASGWPTDSKGWQFWSSGVDDFLAITQFRTNLHSAFPSQR